MKKVPLAWIRGDAFVKSAVICAAIVVLMGGGATYALRYPIEASVREEAVREVVARMRPPILKMLGPQDLEQSMTGARYQELDRDVKDYLMGADIARLKIWNSAGTVVYSTLSSQIGDFFPESPELQRALQGQTAWEVTWETESPEDREMGEVMEVYIPLAWRTEGKPAGVLEVYMPYAPHRRHLDSIRNAIFGAAAVVSLTVFAVLALLYRTGYEAIRRERDRALQRQREVEGLNRLLQGDIAHYYQVQERLLQLREQVAQPASSEAEAEVPKAQNAWMTRQIRELAELVTKPLAPEQQKFEKEG